jgi:hypothetical protein
MLGSCRARMSQPAANSPGRQFYVDARDVTRAIVSIIPDENSLSWSLLSR